MAIQTNCPVKCNFVWTKSEMSGKWPTLGDYFEHCNQAIDKFLPNYNNK